MFEFGFLPYQKASTIGEGVFHSRESEQGVGSFTPPYATPVRNTDTGHPSKYLPHSAMREKKMSCKKIGILPSTQLLHSNAGKIF